MSVCLRAQEMDRYLEGRMDSNRLAELKGHASSCPRCALLLAEWDALRALVEQPLEMVEVQDVIPPEPKVVPESEATEPPCDGLHLRIMNCVKVMPGPKAFSKKKRQLALLVIFVLLGVLVGWSGPGLRQAVASSISGSWIQASNDLYRIAEWSGIGGERFMRAGALVINALPVYIWWCIAGTLLLVLGFCLVLLRGRHRNSKHSVNSAG